VHDDHDAPGAPQERAPERPASVFSIVDASTLFAPLEEPDYLIDGVVRRGSLVELVGYGSSGKSWIADDALLSVATGKPWLGRFETKPGATLGLDWENGLYEARRRLQAIARARQLPPVTGIGLVPMPTVYMNDPKFGTAVEAVAEGRALIVIDTLKAANPGTDENDSNMRVGLDALRRVGEKTGCAFLVLVHAKKTSANVSAIDAREAGRGSSAIFDAADSVLHMTYVEGEPLRVQQTKARLGRPAEPFLVNISDTENGGVLVWATDAGERTPGQGEKFDALCRSVLEFVRQRPGASARWILEQVGGRYTSVKAALERLEHDGAVRNTGDNAGGRWFAA